MQAAVIVGLIQAVLAASPQIAEVAKATKEFITNLFTAKVITKEEQDALHAYVDSCMALALAGAIPDHWRVEPDPV